MDIKKWLEQNMTQLNLSDEDRAAAQRLFSGSLGQALGANAVEQSVFNSQLDQQRNRYEAQVRERDQWNMQWQERYIEDLMALGAVDRLAAAGFDVSQLQNTAGGGARNQFTGEQFTKEQVAQLLQQQARQFQEQLEPVRTGLVDFTTFVTDAALDYRETYGKKFDTAKFREYAFENRTKYPTLEVAYMAFTEEDRKAKDILDRKKWEDTERERIRQEVMQNIEIPEAAPGVGDGSPLFTQRDNAKPNDQTPSAAESRQNFTRKWAGKDFNLTI